MWKILSGCQTLIPGELFFTKQFTENACPLQVTTALLQKYLRVFWKYCTCCNLLEEMRKHLKIQLYVLSELLYRWKKLVWKIINYWSQKVMLVFLGFSRIHFWGVVFQNICQYNCIFSVFLQMTNKKKTTWTLNQSPFTAQ